MSTLAGCNGGSEKIQLRIGFWPETTETRDVAMYNEWKKQFEADYPQYEIIGDPYTYDTATIATKYMHLLGLAELEKVIEHKWLRK